MDMPPLSGNDTHYPIVAGMDQTGCSSKQHQGKDCAKQSNQQLDASGYLFVRDAQFMQIGQGWRLGLDGRDVDAPMLCEGLYLRICLIAQYEVCRRTLRQSFGPMAIGCLDDLSQCSLQGILIHALAPGVECADTAGTHRTKSFPGLAATVSCARVLVDCQLAHTFPLLEARVKSSSATSWSSRLFGGTKTAQTSDEQNREFTTWSMFSYTREGKSLPQNGQSVSKISRLDRNSIHFPTPRIQNHRPRYESQFEREFD